MEGRSYIMKKIAMPKSYHSEKYDLDIQTYIPSDIVMSIAETALQMDNYMKQQICVAVNVIGECTNIDVEKVLNDMDVDIIMYSGLWNEVKSHIVNIHEIYDYIKHAEDVHIAIAKFFNITLPEFMEKLDKDLTKYIKRLPKGKEWDELIKSIPKSMNDVIKLMEDDGNAEVIRGALKLIENEGKSVGDIK